ncbi:uncharacterized protein LOC114129221 [Aphis gossypii]|uniref:Uncharacterized protein n=1 Tax=Aphis gossypii TaxID=80765 RepID=A0A9P0NK41_APHGO|nr:uncharacterized protein LOC114129221 [Aphis gossypii]CAH1725667.1 unnamed protein product [Aphis gossypii]
METTKPQPVEQNFEQSSTSLIIAAPIPAVSHVEKSSEVVQIPIRNGKPLVEFTPEMNSVQRQEVIIAAMNKLRKKLEKLKKKINKYEAKKMNASTKKKNVGSDYNF